MGLTNEELQKIIDQFDENNLKEQGIFGILQYGGGSDESFIRANKEGLQLFTLELLKSARDADSIIGDNEKNTITIDNDEDWIDENSDTFIHYIEPIKDKKIKSKEHKSSLAEKLIPYGCGLILTILALLIIIGLGTIANWLF